MLTLQETQSVHDLMNRQKSNLLLIFIFYIVCQVSVFNFHITWLVFLILLISLDIGEGREQQKHPIPTFNVMMIHTGHQTSVSKQITLLDGVDLGPSKQRVCWHGLIDPFMKL